MTGIADTCACPQQMQRHPIMQLAQCMCLCLCLVHTDDFSRFHYSRSLRSLTAASHLKACSNRGSPPQVHAPVPDRH